MSKAQNQGEGDYQAAERYTTAARKFVASGKVEAAARAAAPTSPEEAAALLRAEGRGRQRVKRQQPAATLLRKPG